MRSNGPAGRTSTVSIRFSTASWFGIRRLKMEAGLRRWRLFSVRYAKERVWVERWLHMIDRSLTRQPAAASEIVQTATMIQGYGDVYRQGMADWNAIIDGLAKPTFDGVLALPDLAGAVAEARAAALPDPRQAALKRKIAEIRARVQAGLERGIESRSAQLFRIMLCFTRSARSSRPPPCRPGDGGVPLEMVAAHADLVAHEFIAELEGVEPVATRWCRRAALSPRPAGWFPVRPGVRRGRRASWRIPRARRYREWRSQVRWPFPARSA